MTRGILLEYDFNYNDRVELEEFRAVFAMFSRILGEDALGKSPAEVDAAFAATDSKKVGHICIEEFKPFVEQLFRQMIAKQKELENTISHFKEVLSTPEMLASFVQERFEEANKSGSGFLTREELLEEYISCCRRLGMSEEALKSERRGGGEALFEMLDVNRDGRIDVGEFVPLMSDILTERIHRLEQEYDRLEFAPMTVTRLLNK